MCFTSLVRYVPILDLNAPAGLQGAQGALRRPLTMTMEPHPPQSGRTEEADDKSERPGEHLLPPSVHQTSSSNTGTSVLPHSLQSVVGGRCLSIAKGNGMPASVPCPVI